MPDKKREAMMVVLNHYVHHHELVLKKLNAAQKATLLSVSADKKENKEELIRLEKLWADILEIYGQCGISEEELFTVENILESIPGDIKERYREIIASDETIQVLIEKMNRREYEKAKHLIESIQSTPNPMSGLMPDDYEIEGDDMFRDKATIFDIKRKE